MYRITVMDYIAVVNK